MYTIGQVAEMFDLPVSTLRYYDRNWSERPAFADSAIRNSRRFGSSNA